MNRSSPLIFLGYPNGVNGYICYNPTIGKFILSRDVIFLEDDFSENSKLSRQESIKNTRLQTEDLTSHPLGLVVNPSSLMVASESQNPTNVKGYFNITRV